jgi:hypothetical protein
LSSARAPLVENVDRAMQAEPVRRSDGKEVPGAYAYNGNVANEALS